MVTGIVHIPAESPGKEHPAVGAAVEAVDVH